MLLFEGLEELPVGLVVRRRLAFREPVVRIGVEVIHPEHLTPVPAVSGFVVSLPVDVEELLEGLVLGERKGHGHGVEPETPRPLEARRRHGASPPDGGMGSLHGFR